MYIGNFSNFEMFFSIADEKVIAEKAVTDLLFNVFQQKK